MAGTASSTSPGSALVVGASRTIGLTLAGELLERGWRVIGTVRGQHRGPLQDLAGRSKGRLRSSSST